MVSLCHYCGAVVDVGGGRARKFELGTKSVGPAVAAGGIALSERREAFALYSATYRSFSRITVQIRIRGTYVYTRKSNVISLYLFGRYTEPGHYRVTELDVSVSLDFPLPTPPRHPSPWLQSNLDRL